MPVRRQLLDGHPLDAGRSLVGPPAAGVNAAALFQCDSQVGHGQLQVAPLWSNAPGRRPNVTRWRSGSSTCWPQASRAFRREWQSSRAMPRMPIPFRYARRMTA